MAGTVGFPEAFIRLKSALVAYCDRKGALGLQQISDEFDSTFTLFRENGGSEVINSSINGKSLGFQLTMTVEEKLAVLGEVIKEVNGDKITCTRADFSKLQR
ncbi:MAG: hypothetical protein V7609_2100 [Verrucomicrobiota bacterium]